MSRLLDEIVEDPEVVEERIAVIQSDLPKIPGHPLTRGFKSIKVEVDQIFQWPEGINVEKIFFESLLHENVYQFKIPSH